MTRPHHDIAMWQTHVTEDDCEVIIRTNDGRAFYCTIFPSEFCQSPVTTAQYFKCLHLLRSGEEEIDDFYMEDALDWLSQAFEPLIFEHVADSFAMPDKRPTLSDYLFPTSYVCRLAAKDDKLLPYLLKDTDHDWGSPLTILENSFVEDLKQWTRSYRPSEVEICYNKPEDTLIKPPQRVSVDGEDKFFFKRLNRSFGKQHATDELERLEKIARGEMPPDARVCCLHGVVRDGCGVAGMLFPYINKQSVLSKAKACPTSPPLRKRWAEQITHALKVLHERGIIWGDAKAENILIDEFDNAWIIDFGGSYTVGWVDKEKAGTLEGDRQGLAKILDILG